MIWRKKYWCVSRFVVRGPLHINLSKWNSLNGECDFPYNLNSVLRYTPLYVFEYVSQAAFHEAGLLASKHARI